MAVQMPIQFQHIMHVQFGHSFHNLFIVPIETHCTAFLPFFMGLHVILLLRNLCVTNISQIYFLHTELQQEHHVMVMLYF